MDCKVKFIAGIIQAGAMAINGIFCIISEFNKQERCRQLQDTIYNAQQEMKRVNERNYLLK